MEDDTMSNKQCTRCDTVFELDKAAVEFYKQFDVSNPELCSKCKKIQLMCWRNERTFYPATCSKCKTSMISCFNPAYAAPVMCNDCWWSTDFNPLQYGRDYDFSRPFLSSLSMWKCGVFSCSSLN